jgi:hypothetical protein
MYADFLEVAGLLFWLIILMGMSVGAGALLYRLIIHLWAYTEEKALTVEARRLDIERQRRDVDLTVMSPHALPVPRNALDSLDVGRAYAGLLDAVKGHAPTLHSLTYSPRMDYRYDNDVHGLLPEQASTVPTFQAPDLWSLYHQGHLPDHGFLLGYNLDTGVPVQAGWNELYSALVGGVSRSGKSTLIRGVLAQAALQGSRFVIVDKHFAVGNDSMAASLMPLRSLMLTNIAAGETQMFDTLRLVRGVADARLSGRDKDKTPLVLVVDEATGLFMRSNLAEELIGLLGLLTQESAKTGVFAIVIGQQWTGEILPTTVRNSFVSAISCRARRDVARVMSGSTEFAKIAETLQPPGQAVWMQPNREIVKIAIPNCTAHHIELVAREVSSGVYEVPKLLPEVEPGPASGPLSGPADENNTMVDPDENPIVTLTIDPIRAELVRQLYVNNAPRAEIIKQLWKIEAKQGTRAFKNAARELDEILRALLKGQLR